jgi:endonuclease YncB( thermonuclease family)
MLREAALSFALSALIAGPARGQDCMSAAADVARIAGVTLAGDVMTDAGERLRLAGVAPPSEGARPWIERLSATWTGAQVKVQRLASAPDRWGRMPAMVFVPASIDTLPPLALNAMALAEGIALADPAEVPPGCRAALAEAEAAARRRRAGLWRDQSRHVLAASPTREEARAHAGQFRLVEGKVRRVTERRSQIFIDFGPYGSLAPSLRTSRRNIAQILPSGVSLSELQGRTLRVRGIMETTGERLWMTLDRASLIEVLN